MQGLLQCGHAAEEQLQRCGGKKSILTQETG